MRCWSFGKMAKTWQVQQAFRAKMTERSWRKFGGKMTVFKKTEYVIENY